MYLHKINWIGATVYLYFQLITLNLSGFFSNLKELFSQASSDHCSLNFNVPTCSVTLSAPKHTSASREILIFSYPTSTPYEYKTKISD